MLSKIKKEYNCKYLISANTKSFTAISKPNVLSRFEGVSELFTFPLPEISPPGTKNLNFTIDTWPAYASEHTKTEKQIFVGNNRLCSQGIKELKLPNIKKPKLLEDMETIIRKGILKYEVKDGPMTELKFQIYKEALDLFISQCSYYSPILAKIQNSYDSFIAQQRLKIQEMLPIKEMLWSVTMESELKINEIRNLQNSEINDLKEEIRRYKHKIEHMKQESIELHVLAKQMNQMLELQIINWRSELDGRKILISEVNDLTSRLREMELLARAEQELSTDDPVLLKSQIVASATAITSMTTKLNICEARYEAMIPQSEYERVVRQLDEKTKIEKSLNDYIESAKIRYNILDNHCNTLTTNRDLYNLQVIYINRVLGSKGEANQKIDYITSVLYRYRKLVHDKSPAELARLVNEDLANAEAGILPVLTRIKNINRSKADT